jgi:hypothetical protein
MKSPAAHVGSGANAWTIFVASPDFHLGELFQQGSKALSDLAHSKIERMLFAPSFFPKRAEKTACCCSPETLPDREAHPARSAHRPSERRSG